ncbi:MAG: aminotransferase class I/II-fold pyridoxal phosphate-dependent enzyme [Opitutales bacterium]|nr:aminotransferase class I/II-fold pyridoxal phosphate-dependent enzyme [Opitutales bacterium]
MGKSPSDFVAKHVLNIPKSGIRDFFAIAATMKDAVSLGIGEPDFVTPWHIREAAIFALEKGKTSYTENLGMRALRYEISKYVEANFNASYNPDNEILVSVGASEALDVALRAIIEPGDKVMYHAPCFVSYNPSVALCHGEAIPVYTCGKNRFELDIEDVKRAWRPGVKAFIINFPTNPTGGTATRAQLEELAKFAKEKDFLIISDEIYAELTYDGGHVSIASLDGMKDRVIFIHGFSKAFAMTGFRLGYACGPREIIDAMMKTHQYAIMCASIMSQEAGVEALKNGKSDMEFMREKYRQRRDFIVGKFNEFGMDCFLPRGTFYAFPSIARFGKTSMEVAKFIITEAKVAMVPGSAFGEPGEGYLRASFATSYENIIKAMDRLSAILPKLEKL